LYCNIDHLTKEKEVINQRRKKCKKRHVCLGHRKQPDCIFRWWVQ